MSAMQTLSRRTTAFIGLALVAAMLVFSQPAQADGADVVEGTLASVDVVLGKVHVEQLDGTLVEIVIDISKTQIKKNGNLSKIEVLSIGDKVHIHHVHFVAQFIHVL